MKLLLTILAVLCTYVLAQAPGTPSNSTCTLIPGFGIDEQESKIYFLGRCGGSETLDPPGTVYLFSSNLDGSSTSSLTVLPEDTGSASPNYSVVAQFLTLSPYDFYIVRNVRNAVDFNVIDRETYEESITYAQRNSPRPSFFFDLESGYTYSCLGFQVVRFSSILTTPAYNTTPSAVLYDRSDFPGFLVCYDVRVVGSTLYVLGGGGANGSVVFQGSLDGSSPLTPVFNIYDTSPAFDADSTAVYYSDEFSINRYFVSSERGPTLLFPDHVPHPNFTTVQAVGGYVYFDDGAYIRRVSTSTLAAEELIPYQFVYTTTCNDVEASSSDDSTASSDSTGSSSDGSTSSSSDGSTSSSTDSATSSDDAPTDAEHVCNITLSQVIRTSWKDQKDTFYLYDISIQNVGTQPVTTPIFFIKSTNTNGLNIVQSWNLVIYATTVPTQTLVSLFPNTVIAPGAFYTSAGYITNTTLTQLTFDSCVSPAPSS